MFQIASYNSHTSWNNRHLSFIFPWHESCFEYCRDVRLSLKLSRAQYKENEGLI